MTTRHLVDPELVAFLDALPPFGNVIEERRQIRENLAASLPPAEDYARPDVSISTHLVPGRDGAPDIPVILYRPVDAESPLPVFLNIHGGGYVFGTAADTGPGDVRTASELGCLVVSVDYRLAPETPAPGSVEDCYAALEWLYRNGEELGLDRTRFAIGGQSAGGGLAAALALLARDRGEIELCFQLLVYPMLDDRTACLPPEELAGMGEFVWKHADNAEGWRALLGCEPGSDGISPYAAAARASDLSRLPPAYITVGMLDLFLDEDIQYARRLIADGNKVELHVLPGAYHGFELAASARLTRESEAERRAALAKAFRV
ncbi:esterase [Novosphingobium endophyticum]|uniref:Esterase n=1 Tax=Novosphingobium endophyticum TaxID=1955250 RepID=A0A916TTX9_9SPHN|nr:alpha/beta hydrolase [Novosphingobium endophyticum]GGC06675.1 esterase [Novosphingobium endophyticum]